jgi:hypothetical protein
MSQVPTKLLTQLSWHNAWPLQAIVILGDRELTGMHFSHPRPPDTGWSCSGLSTALCLTSKQDLHPSTSSRCIYSFSWCPVLTLLSKILLSLHWASFHEPDAMGNKLKNVKHGFCPSEVYVLVRENSKMWEPIIKHPEHLYGCATFLSSLSSLDC